MRPSSYLFIIFLLIGAVDACLLANRQMTGQARAAGVARQQTAVAGLGLTDLCVATEARYTRHPAASDSVAPFMDHPGAIEHFPSGSFWRPVEQTAGRRP
ncbi:MAG: hypothetical protein HY789_10910 [Deltaproteobacteria bacterium]|nr:hypothetical protein [Deltaproteobacteria bacterium]